MRYSLIVVLVTGTYAIQNGKGITPPMGWRSWNLFGGNVDQTLIQSQMDGLVSRKRTVDGVPTSLLDLGYSDVGLDDAWQLCGSYGPDQYTYHDQNGVPVVDTTKFPDFKSMTDYAHSLGITAGWYGNNCICEDHCSSEDCYSQDVKALVSYGFDSVKLDNCGKETDLDKWADYISEAGVSILIENCHWGIDVPTKDWCPFNYYRTSGDIRANYESMIGNLMTTVQFAQQNLSTPGCWAYPDMLEVGCSDGPGGSTDSGLTYNEARSHFAAWCVVSSPLILGYDLLNDTVIDEVWSIVSNKELIAVNQAWAGESGTLFQESKEKVILSDRSFKSSKDDLQSKSLKKLHGQKLENTLVSKTQQWSKQVNSDSHQTAVFLLNNDRRDQTVSLHFSEVPSLSSFPSNQQYSVRCLYGHQDLGTFSNVFSAKLESHDSRMLLITPVV